MAYNDGSVPTLAEMIIAAFIPQVYSKEVLMHTKSKLVCVSCFNTTFKNDLKKGHTVYIPVFSEVSTTEVTPGTEPTAANAASASPKSITVNYWREASVEITDLESVETLADYMTSAAESAAYAVSKYIDTTVGALFRYLASSSVYGSDGQTFTDDIFRALVQTLDESDVPDDNRYLIGDPAMKSDLLDIDKFVAVDYVKTPVVPTGMFGSLYNAKVYITNNLTSATTGNYGVYAHKDALGVVIQKNPRSRVWDLGYKFITKIIVDSAWGVGELRDSFGKSFYTRSA